MMSDTQPLQIPFYSPFRLMSPFAMGIGLGLVCAVFFAACQQQPKLIEDTSPIITPALVPPIVAETDTLNRILPANNLPSDAADVLPSVALPNDSIEHQLDAAETNTAPKSGVKPTPAKALKPLPEEAKLHVPKQ